MVRGDRGDVSWHTVEMVLALIVILVVGIVITLLISNSRGTVSKCYGLGGQCVAAGATADDDSCKTLGTGYIMNGNPEVCKSDDKCKGKTCVCCIKFSSGGSS